MVGDAPHFHEIITSYGLLSATVLLFLATVWYGWATARMAGAMRAELRLRTTPFLGFGSVEVEAADWTEIAVRQRLVNTGVAFVTLSSASLEWWPYLKREDSKIHLAENLLPVHLPPGGHIVLSFRLAVDDLVEIKTSTFQSPAQVIDGEVSYTFAGLTGKSTTRLFSLVHSVSQSQTSATVVVGPGH